MQPDGNVTLKFNSLIFYILFERKDNMNINIGKLELFISVDGHILELGYFIDDGTYYNLFPENWEYYKQFDVYKLLKNEIIFHLFYRLIEKGVKSIGGHHYDIRKIRDTKAIYIYGSSWDSIGEFVHNGYEIVDTTGWSEISV
jgi:hypothetical protein